MAQAIAWRGALCYPPLLENRPRSMTKFRQVLMMFWAISFIGTFFVFKFWMAALLVLYMFLSPGLLLATVLLKSTHARLKASASSIIEGAVEGLLFVLLLACLDTFTILSISPILSVMFGSWLFTINQLNRAYRPGSSPREELMNLAGFLPAAFVGFNIWLFLFI